jgi:glutaredoxin
MKWRFVLAVAAAVSLGLAPGCSHKARDDDGTIPKPKGDLPALSIRDDTPDLMLTWIDDKGDVHVELHPPDVPAEGRPLVRIVVTDREAGTRELLYITDLTQKQPDGSYAARAMPRREWEELIEKRRNAYLAKVAPAPPAPPPPDPNGGAPAAPSALSGITAIIYGAEWCHPCHQAQAYLKSKGVRVIEKNIEETPGAAAEMRSKLEQSGQHGGGIPVIDVQGQIMVGFNPVAIDRALAKAARGTTL